MYILILLLPFLSFLFSLNKLTGRFGPLLSCILLFITWFITILSFFEVCISESSVILNIYSWIDIHSLHIPFSLHFDCLTISMTIPVITISLFVQLYSLGYMSHDLYISRFFSYLSLFSFFMVLLISADNFLLLFIGWEGVGLASYLLINFWFTRLLANFASLKAFIINRIGDQFLLLGLILLILNLGDLSFNLVFSLVNLIHVDLLFIICLLLFIGSMAKSAQLPFHSWLSSAMEGPTPVSALIHAATMVTAGVYLLIRISPLLHHSSTLLLFITWIGGISSFTAGCSGLIESDLKKIIAFSTTSQLGYMFLCCGISQFNLALFHLINHAMFKALLFMSAGSIIHSLFDHQDIRRFGSLVLYLPFTYSFILIGSLSLIAFPFLTGFYSKDLLLELSSTPFNYTTTLCFILAFASAILTTLYSSRLLIYSFLSSPHFSPSVTYSLFESPFFMFFPQFILFILSVLFGYLTQDIFLGIGSTLFSHSIFIHPDLSLIYNGTLAPLSFLKYLPLLCLILLFSLFPFYSSKLNSIHSDLYSFHFPSPSSLSPNPIVYHTSLLNHFNLFNSFFLSLGFSFSNLLFRYFDRGFLEFIGPLGLSHLSHFISFHLILFSDFTFILHLSFHLLIFIFIFIFAFYFFNGFIPFFFFFLILCYVLFP